MLLLIFNFIYVFFVFCNFPLVNNNRNALWRTEAYLGEINLFIGSRKIKGMNTDNRKKYSNDQRSFSDAREKPTTIKNTEGTEILQSEVRSALGKLDRNKRWIRNRNVLSLRRFLHRQDQKSHKRNIQIFEPFPQSIVFHLQ